MSENATALLNLLTTGRDSATITEERPMLSRNIAALLSFDSGERAVREAARELRLLGYLICTNDRGYYMGTPEQAYQTVRVLMAKGWSTLAPARAMLKELSLRHQLALSTEFE